MEDQIYGYLVKHSIAIDKCGEGVSVCMDALRKQAKINRIQRLTITFLSVLVVACAKNIMNLNTTVERQEKRLNALEEPSEVEDNKKRKGE